MSQPLLLPQEVLLDEFQRQSLLENLVLVTQHGFDVRQREERLWVIHACHMPTPHVGLRTGYRAAKPHGPVRSREPPAGANHPMAATVACHSAVRAGNWLTEQDMKAIIEQLADTPEPHHCPHGGPMVITIPNHRLEREFRPCSRPHTP